MKFTYVEIETEMIVFLINSQVIFLKSFYIIFLNNFKSFDKMWFTWASIYILDF
jgi:hypothetical protein